MKPVHFLLLLFIATGSHAEDNQTDVSPFQFQRKVETETKVEGIGVIEADDHLFREAAEKFADVRLFRIREGVREERPYLVERERPGPVKIPARRIPTKTVAFEEREDGSIEITVELTKEEMSAASLKIESPLRDFEKAIEVWGGDSKDSWEPLFENGLIFDRERFLDYRQTQVGLRENRYRFFKVIIKGATDEQKAAVREVTRRIDEASGTTVQERTSVKTRPFRVDRLVFYTAAQEHEVGRGEVEYSVTIESVNENEENKTTEVYLAAGKAPLRELTLLTPDKNFRREIRLEVPKESNPDEWRAIHRDTAHLYEVGAFRDEKLAVRFDELNYERYRLVIENGDSAPLKIEGVEGRGSVYKILFLAEPGDGWEIFYGADSEEVKKPQYDIAAIFKARQAVVKQEELTLSDPQANPEFVESGEGALSLLQQGWLLKLAIALVVGGLVWVLVKAARQMDASSELNK